ncbi:SEC-C metal-binding domain-containing protein [Lachnospiraceae bacterium 54-53]
MGAYQLKITIKGSKPPIWRRILVPERITFKELHQIIQTAFCWSDEHLYQFEFRSEGVRVIPDEANISSGSPCVSSDEAIDRLLSGAGKFTYIYNSDDHWEHLIQVEDKIREYEEGYARVVKFKGDVIPENCGGIAGYYELLEAASRPENKTSPENFKEYDMSAANECLKRETADVSEEEVHIAAVFECYDKNNIMEIAKRHGMSGYSRLKKEELIECTIAHILDREVMKSYFLCARDSEIKLFEQVLAGNHQVPDYETEEMDFFYAGGYVTAGTGNYFMAAEEVEKAYEELNTPDFRMERGRISLIGDYLCAANALYAITPPSVVLETFNKYEEKKLTADELLHVYEQLRPFRTLVEYLEGSFVDAALADQNSFKELCRMQKKVPYYIPTSQEIRFMADNKGFLMSKELSRLSSFLTDKLSVPDNTIPYILHQVQAEISMGGQLEEVVADLKEAGITLSSGEHMEELSGIVADVWNNTRMVFNRGHKPYEMVMKGLEEVTVQRKNIQKIYPNDSCPCGSGKKYKKCCGKRK